MKFILGKKIDMTQIWVGEDKKSVTRVAVGPCTVVQLKTEAKDGYKAVQIGYGEKKAKNLNKPQIGHMKGLGNFRWLREFRLDKRMDKAGVPDLKLGDVIDISTFNIGDKLTVTGNVKGRGFAGVVKRHGFHGHNATHGTKDQERMPGSIGAGGVQHVFKGVRMAGRMGGNQVTFKGLEIVKIDEANGILYIEGAMPGARGSFLKLVSDGEIKLAAKATATIEETKVEEAVVEANTETNTEVASSEVTGEQA